MSPPETANRWDNGTSWHQWPWIKDLPGKVIHCRHGQWSDEEDITIMSKVAKGKGKSRSEVGKSETVLKSKTTNPRTAFQIRGDWWTLSLSMFLYKGLYKEKETSLLTLCMANLVWQQLLCLKSGRQRGAPPVPVAFTKEFVSFLDRIFYSFFVFKPRSFFRSWFFHKHRTSMCEFCKVRDVNKVWK